MLGDLEAQTGRVIVADLEQGVGTVSRLAVDNVDILVLVVEPMAKSLETARRARIIAEDIGLRVMAVANRATEDDLEYLRSVLPDMEIAVVPDDDAIRDADLDGVAPVDHAPDCPAVQAIGRLLDSLLAQAAV